MNEINPGTNLPAVSPIPGLLVLLVYACWLVYLYKKRSLLKTGWLSRWFPLCFLAITLLNASVLLFFVLDSPYIPPAVPFSLDLGTRLRIGVSVMGAMFGIAFLIAGWRVKDRLHFPYTGG